MTKAHEWWDFAEENVHHLCENHHIPRLGVYQISY